MFPELIPFPAFVAIWAAYGLAGLPILFSGNAARKRRLFRGYTIGAGVLFLVGLMVTGFPVFMVVLAVPFIVVTTRMNLSLVRFCDSCGATAWRQLPFQEVRFCAKCGHDLVATAPRGATSIE
jgi:hypothetical protein